VTGHHRRRINGVAMGIVPFFTRLAGRAQSGYMFHYAFAMVSASPS
jgi:NADH-quinone oxidoreductase subunit L